MAQILTVGIYEGASSVSMILDLKIGFCFIFCFLRRRPGLSEFSESGQS